MGAATHHQIKLGSRIFHCTLHQHAQTRSTEPPLVAVAGWGMVANEWGWLPGELARTRDVLTFDNQGIGLSADLPEDGFTLDQWAQDILQLVAQVFGPEIQFVVLGFSMGAFVAGHLAATRPDRIVAAVLMGAQGTRSSAVAGARDFFKLAVKTMATPNNTLQHNDLRLRYFFDPAVVAAELPQHWDAVVQRNFDWQRPAPTINKQLKVMASADSALNQIKCPVLVMSGERDVIVPPSNSSLVIEQLTLSCRKELMLLPGQGHFCWGLCIPGTDDAPEATISVARHIEGFLSCGDNPLTAKL